MPETFTLTGIDGNPITVVGDPNMTEEKKDLIRHSVAAAIEQLDVQKSLDGFRADGQNVEIVVAPTECPEADCCRCEESFWLPRDYNDPNAYVQVTGGCLKHAQDGYLITPKGGLYCPDCVEEYIEICRGCGCTWERACDGGCYWVVPGWCSVCEKNRLDFVQYEIVSTHRGIPQERPGIRCRRCDATSWHPMDVKNKWCARCESFLEHPYEFIGPLLPRLYAEEVPVGKDVTARD